MFDTMQLLPMLPAHDLDRARDWYRDHLGLTPVQEFSDQEINAFSRFLSYRSQYAGTAKNTAACWITDDFDAAVASLRERGVTLETYDMPELRWDDGVATDPAGSRTCWFVDSEGNIFMLTEFPAGEATPGD